MTSLQELVRDLAEAALVRPKGAALTYEIGDECPTKKACKARALMMRANFHAMRQKDRRIKKQIAFDTGEPAPCEYDKLLTAVEETSNGWRIRIAKGEGALLGGGARIIDVETGLPINLYPDLVEAKPN